MEGTHNSPNITSICTAIFLNTVIAVQFSVSRLEIVRLGPQGHRRLFRRMRAIHRARARFAYRDRDVQVIGYPRCSPNDYALTVMGALHPFQCCLRWGAKVLSLPAGRRHCRVGSAAETLVTREAGGTRHSVAKGRVWIESACARTGHSKPTSPSPASWLARFAAGPTATASQPISRSRALTISTRVEWIGVPCSRRLASV